MNGTMPSAQSLQKKIESHARKFRDFCPEKTSISIVIAYPGKWISKLRARPNVRFEGDGMRPVVINVGENNFAEIFPKDHEEFVDRLKNSGKRSIEDCGHIDRLKKHKS